MSSNKLYIEEDMKVIKHNANQIIPTSILKGISDEYIEDAIGKEYYLL